MNILVDTDIVIEILRARDEAILSKWTRLALSGADIRYSPVTAAEVWAGALPKEHVLIARFFRPLVCVASDYAIGELAGGFLRKYTKSHGVEIGDALIAATAVASRVTLWTRNRKHYPMPGLNFFD